jgi:hypothetical protein
VFLAVCVFLLARLGLWVPAVYSLVYVVICALCRIPLQGAAVTVYLIGLALSFAVSVLLTYRLIERGRENRRSGKNSGNLSRVQMRGAEGYAPQYYPPFSQYCMPPQAREQPQFQTVSAPPQGAYQPPQPQFQSPVAQSQGAYQPQQFASTAQNQGAYQQQQFAPAPQSQVAYQPTQGVHQQQFPSASAAQSQGAYQQPQGVYQAWQTRYDDYSDLNRKYFDGAAAVAPPPPARDAFDAHGVPVSARGLSPLTAAEPPRALDESRFDLERRLFGVQNEETPMVFATRRDPDVLVYEYSDRLKFYKKTKKGLVHISTEYKNGAGV